jgi:hypothetical protein
VKLRARAKGWAPSAPLEFQVAADGPKEDVQLQLRTPGRIVGEVLDAGRTPEPDRPVSIEGESLAPRTRTDAQGRFAFEDLPAGQYDLRTLATTAEASVNSRSDDYPDPLPRTARVTLGEGQTSSVTLSAEGGLKDPILIKGRVVCSGKAVAGCDVGTYWRTDGSGSFSPRVRSAADGSFQLRVDGAASYPFDVEPSVMGPRTTFVLPIESRKVVEIVLELPAGRIEGCVVDREGRRVGGVRLELRSERTSSPGIGVNTYGGSTQSDAQGRFQFDHLAAGSYSIMGTPSTETDPRLGKTTQNGFVVTGGAALRDVKFVLSLGCHLDGRVLLPGGDPGAGAWIHIRDASGWSVSPSCSADEVGKFTLDGLPPGRYSFQAYLGNRASQESVDLDLGEALPTTLDLALQDSTDLYVQLLDSSGNPTPAMLQILDARGRDDTLMLIEMQREDTATDKLPGRRYGPIPPGKYTLQCSWVGGGSLTQELQVTGERTQQLTLRAAN